MKSVCFLSQFPPPMHGLSKAVETLYNSCLNQKYGFSKINITDNKHFLRSLWLLWRNDSDVVYFTLSQTRGGNLRDLVFLKVIRWRQKRCLVHIHGGYYRQMIDNDCPEWQHRMNYSEVKHLAGGIVLGNSLRGIFKDMLPDNRIFVCPNCIDNSFVPKSLERKLDDIMTGTSLHILYLSNFIESKGYREVLSLAEMAAKRGDKDKFVFHFAGKFFDTIEELFFKEHSQGMNNVVFHGIVGGQAKVDLLKNCQVFTLLTRYPNEGQPISILEAMGNGMTVITTNHAGIPEIVSSDNGFVCDKNHLELDAIYEYLLKCYTDRRYLERVCKFNHDITMGKYTEKQYIDNMDKIFERICND